MLRGEREQPGFNPVTSLIDEITRKHSAQEELKKNHFVIPSLDGVGIAITGPTSGIGRATAQLLAQSGAHLFLVARNADRLQKTIREISETTGNVSLFPILADLSNEKTVGDAVRRIQDSRHPLHILINNAGEVPFRSPQISDEIDVAIRINHIAPFILTLGLLEKINSSPDTQVVRNISNLASTSHFGVHMPKEGIYHEERNPLVRYGISHLCKLSVTLLELAPRLRLLTERGHNSVNLNMVEPGFVKTGIAPGKVIDFLESIAVKLSWMIEPYISARGIAQSVLPPLSENNGKYLEVAQLSEPKPASEAETRRILLQTIMTFSPATLSLLSESLTRLGI